MARIFISYRREESDIWVGRLGDELRRHFPSEQIFQDVASIDPGAPFKEVLDKALASASAMLVVIGPQWLAAADKQGRRRLKQPADWVRQEVAESLRRPGVRVFPLLVGGAEMPAEEDLPEVLKPLAERQAFELTVRHWTNDVAQPCPDLEARVSDREQPVGGLRKGHSNTRNITSGGSIMDRDELLSAAKAALGEGKPDDYVIAPSRHADELAAKAPALAKVLRRSELRRIAESYEKRGAEAGRAQSAFKRTANLANWSVFLTAVFSALLLMSSPLAALLPGIPSKGLQIALALCGILSGALGTMWLFKIRAGRMVERWMSARAAAETRRVKYFELATASRDDGAAGEVPLALLQCEYFRRYQLDVQLIYFRERGTQHERAADRMLNLSAFAVGLASIATGVGGLLGDAWIALVGLGVIATGLSGFASANETASQDSRNMERYRKALDVLEGLSGRLDDVRLAAAGGERGPLEQFVAVVHEQISLEHRQWLETAESTMASIAKLEESLAKLKAKRPEAEQRGNP